MSLTAISIPIAALLWLVVPGVFSIAFFLWWRRLRHWSFGLLSTACALSVVAQLCGFLARNIPRWGKTEEQAASTPDIMALVHATIVFYLIMGILLLVGAFGLLSAARDEFLLDDAVKRKSTHAA
jgi:hypothetical protein